MIIVTVTRPGTAVDLLLWRQFGLAGSALLEQTFEANPGLASFGAELPIGAIVNLPEYAPTIVSATRWVIDLFGDSDAE